VQALQASAAVSDLNKKALLSSLNPRESLPDSLDCFCCLDITCSASGQSGQSSRWHLNENCPSLSLPLGPAVIRIPVRSRVVCGFNPIKGSRNRYVFREMDV
jgi:hypothetical protein